MDGLRGKRVLIVDDEPMIRFVVAEEIESAGAETVEAEDGLAALELIEQGLVPDVLVTDVRMPRMDGWTLAERARALHPGLPVLYVTGYSDVTARPVAGGQVVSKPFRPGALSSTVDALVQRR
jgi:CheY-like chemotaxis protein